MREQMIQKMTGRTFSCILFDLGSTLWYRDADRVAELKSRGNLQAIHLLRQSIEGLHLPGNDDAEAGKLLRKAVSRQFHDEIEQNPSVEPEGAEIVQQVLYKTGNVVCDKDLCETVFDALDIRIHQSRRLFADALSTLQEMKKRALQLGVVSNRHWGGKLFREDLKPLGITNYIELERMMISADVRIRKPSPEIYKRALKACKAHHETTMMVGDSLIADIAGAQHQNIFAVWKPKHYNEVSAHLAEKEGITIAEYNLHQLHLLKKHGKVEREHLNYARQKGDEDLTHFFNGAIRPQLIIQDLKELLTWL
jgi:FMN phosphatase YigB (HAD superfamily)